MPISAILFGGRRATNVPLVTESFDWDHGVFLGSIMSSETTAAQAGAVGKLRFDPFAMLPFCGYNMGDYFAHWLEIGEATDADKLPKLFWVNWFRRGEDGSFLWPGFGENSRVLKWVVERVEGERRGASTPPSAGCRPPAPSTPTGLDIDPTTLAELLQVDPESWRQELPQLEEHYRRARRATCPPRCKEQLESLEKRLAAELTPVSRHPTNLRSAVRCRPAGRHRRVRAWVPPTLRERRPACPRSLAWLARVQCRYPDTHASAGALADAEGGRRPGTPPARTSGRPTSNRDVNAPLLGPPRRGWWRSAS